MSDREDLDERPLCSARGCRLEARHVLSWRNPRIHGTARVKTWAACEDHVGTLGDFLAVRGFLLSVEPLPGL